MPQIFTILTKTLFQGITFTRVSRPATEIVYDNNEVFEIGKAKVLKQSPGDACLVIAAGITLDQALKAVPKLEALGIKVRLMDPFTIKPIDKEAILKHAAECNGKVLVVEDHYSEVKRKHDTAPAILSFLFIIKICILYTQNNNLSYTTGWYWRCCTRCSS